MSEPQQPITITDKRKKAGEPPPMHPALSQEEAAALMQQQVQEELERDGEKRDAGEVRQALTAFLVVVGHDGSAVATSDVNTQLVIDREATVDDMFAGASIVVRDINAATTSKHVVFGLNVSAQAMQEKAMAAQLAQQNGLNLGPRRR
jgi:hypothetical protein